MASTHQLIAWGLVVALGLATGTGWMALPKAPNLDPLVLMVLGFNVLVILGALAIEIGRRPYSLHQMHLTALFLFLGAASLFQYSVGRFGIAGPIGSLRSQILVAASATTLWLAGYLAAYEGQRLLGDHSRIGAASRFLVRPILPLRAFVLACFGVVGLAYLAVVGLLGVGTRGAATAAIEGFSEGAGVGGFSGTLAILNSNLVRMLPVVALLAVLLVLNRASRGRLLLAPLAVVLAAGCLVVNNPFAASRMFFTTNLIGFCAPFLLRRLKTGVAIVVAILVGLAFLPALGEARNAADLDELAASPYVAPTSPLEYLATNGDVDSLGMTALCQKWVDRFGHRWGMQILGALLFWVPRVIWVGKPVGTGSMVTEDLGFAFTNFSPPITAEALVDFGLIGVPILGAILGLVLARLDATYWAPGRQVLGSTCRLVDAIYPFWLVCVVYLTRGDLFASLGFTVGFTFWILPLGLGLMIFRSDTSTSSYPAHEVPLLPGVRT